MSASEVPPGLSRRCTMFKRRQGTAQISGHLYEIKLLSLLYLRAFHYDRIKEFQLASNVDEIGAFDDICFRGHVDGLGKPIMIFIQAKHIENKKQTLKIDLSTYFISYLKIREHFDPNNKDFFFKGTFDETESFFVLYTTAKDGINDDYNVESGVCSILKDLIETGGTVKQPYKQEKHVKDLCEVAMKEQMTSLAERIAEFINEHGNVDMLLTDETVLRYHVILARQVFDVSEIQPDGHRIASFRHDFIETYPSEYLTLFKDTLCKEILKKRKINPTDIKKILSEFLEEPTNATKLSKLIETVVTYDNGWFEINNQYTKYFRPHLKQGICTCFNCSLKYSVSQQTVDEALKLAARETFLSPEFKLRVPSAFGNKDITMKIGRITHITKEIIELLDKCKSSKIVPIDEYLKPGFLRLNGGIAGAIGNIFVFDDNPKLMKVTDNCEQLGPLAKMLYENLNKEIELRNKDRSNDKLPNLCDYKFSFKVNKFPKLSLEYTEYEEDLARDFLKKLIIYSEQADEKLVEKILKAEIEENLPVSDYFLWKTDVMTQYALRYLNFIQEWWKLPKEAPYLTENSEIFEKAISIQATENPRMNSISDTYLKKIKQYNYTFTEDALNSLKLQEQHHCTVIVAENTTLTVVKVLQHFKNKHPTVLDLEYIIKLPTNERNALRRELTYIPTRKVLIFVCNTIQDSRMEKKTFENVAEAVRNKNIIIITSPASVHILQTYFFTVDSAIIYDEKNSLIHMTENSRTTILGSGIVKIQGKKVPLKHLLSGWPLVLPANL